MVTSGLVLGITIGTLALFTVAGIWYSRGRIHGVEDYISARNTTRTGMTTATLIASSMGAWILFSPAEAGAAFGGLTAVLGYAVGSATPLVAYAWLGPRIRRLIPEGHSLTEYALARYGPTFYAYVLGVSVFYMFLFLAAEMTGIAGALGLIAGVPAWQTAGLVGLFVLIYTAYGGLQASLFTDTVQTLLILPLIALGLAGALIALGGAGEVHAAVTAGSSQLLDPGFLPGLSFGLMVVIAILGAEMLNQAWWQRIYAAEDEATLRRGFLVSALAVLPMILLAGLFGLAAQGLGLIQGAGDASIAFFLVLNQALPSWIVLVVVLLALLLVMSTADTLLNALSSLVTTDVPKLLDDPDQATLTWSARGLTVLAAIGATAIGAQGLSVLSLFLLADLFAAATFIPLLYGLFSRRASGPVALLASAAGLLVGLAYFPIARTALAGLPGLSGLLPAPSMLVAFAGAALVSGGLVLGLSRLSAPRFELEELARRIKLIEADAPEPDAAADVLGGEA